MRHYLKTLRNGLNNMVMGRRLLPSNSWPNNVGVRTCSGSFFSFSWWCALASFFFNFLFSRASGEGRRRSRRALPLLFFLLLYSSFSFASSFYTDGSLNCCSMSSCASDLTQAFNDGTTCTSSGFNVTCGSNHYSFYLSSSGADVCSSGVTPVSSCVPSSGETVASPSLWSEYFANGSYCDPSTDCVTSGVVTGNSQTDITSGASCSPRTITSTAPTTSIPSPPPVGSCPVGYSPYDSSGCVCSNGQGSFVAINGLSSDPSCNGGITQTLTPTSPVVSSNGTSSCPPGSGSISSGSSISCYSITPISAPPMPSLSSPTGGGGGGSSPNSSFHITSPTLSSNGQLVCPPGSSTISGSSPNSLECIVSGPAPITSPTSSGTSSTSSTSSSSYPSSISLPNLPSQSVSVFSLGSVPSAHESTSQQCPSPVTFTVFQHTFSISFDYACTLAGQVRPIVIGVFSLASLLLIVK